MSRASILFWRSAVRWCRASCKTLGEKTKKGGQRKSRNRKWQLCDFHITPQCFLPQLLKGLVYMLLQNLLHSFNQPHFFFQLLVYGVDDKLVPSPSVPQCQAFTTDLQGNGSRSQGLLGLLLRLSQHTSRSHRYRSICMSLTHKEKPICTIMNIKMRQALVCFKGFFGQITRVRASISLSTFCAQVSNASFQRATSHARSLNLREVSLSSQVVYREKNPRK